jgi:hypothetical protein
VATKYSKGVSHVSYACKPLMGGRAKSTADGKSLDPNATNRIMTLGHNPEEVSPSSTANSRNQK